jgi:GTP-binding protein HflX
LVKAFRATLEEVKYADILLHVVDASDEKAVLEMKVTMEAMESLGAADKPVLVLMNKQDKLDVMKKVIIFPQEGRKQLKISAFNESDRNRVLEELDRMLDEREEEYAVCIPYTEGRFVSLLRQNAKILEEDYLENGTYLKVRSPKQFKNMVKEYLV